MLHEDVRRALVDDELDHLICPEHKTAEVARSTQKTKNNTYKSISSQDPDSE